MGNWVWNNTGKFTLIVLGFFVALFILASSQIERQRKAFMAECQEHQKHYECVAMWRAGLPRR